MFVIPLLLATQVSAQADFLAIVPRVVDAVIDHAASESTEGIKRPLVINIQSFVLQGSMTSAVDLTSLEIRTALARDFGVSTPGTVIQCRSKVQGLSSDCSTWRRGLYVELNCFMISPPGYEVIVTSKQPGLQAPGFGGTVDVTVLKLRFQKIDGNWSLVHQEVVSGT